MTSIFFVLSARNEITGSIPTEIGLLKSLEDLELCGSEYKIDSVMDPLRCIHEPFVST